jgi:hypothetical protein
MAFRPYASLAYRGRWPSDRSDRTAPQREHLSQPKVGGRGAHRNCSPSLRSLPSARSQFGSTCGHEGGIEAANNERSPPRRYISFRCCPRSWRGYRRPARRGETSLRNMPGEPATRRSTPRSECGAIWEYWSAVAAGKSEVYDATGNRPTGNRMLCIRLEKTMGPGSLADIVPRPRYFALHPRAHPAPRHMTNGA